jgi:hypothetical protein
MLLHKLCQGDMYTVAKKVRNVIIEYCKIFYCLLKWTLYLSYASDLVYRENTVRTARVLNSVTVHFKSAE